MIRKYFIAPFKQERMKLPAASSGEFTLREKLKLLKNQTENKGEIIPFLESPEGKAVLVSL
jgi:hypothetical protein